MQAIFAPSSTTLPPLAETRHRHLPHTPPQPDEGGIAEDGTSHAIAALRESTARLELAAALVNLGTWSVDLRSGTATQDARLRTMLGVAEDDPRPTTELWMERIHPAELRATRRRLLSLMREPDTTRVIRAEHRIVRTDGTIRWLNIAGQILTGPDGMPERMVGVAQDITRWRQLHSERQRWADVFQHTTHAVVLSDARTNDILDVNPALAQMLGYAPRELRGRQISEIYDPASLHQLGPAIRATEISGRVVFETVYGRRDNTPVPVEVDATVVSDEAGRPLYRIANIRDLREERRQRERQQLLVQAGELLASSLDYQATIQRVVELAVPAFADWASFSVEDDESGTVRTVSLHHTDELRQSVARVSGERYNMRLTDSAGAGKVLRTGDAELIPDINDQLFAAIARDSGHISLLHALGLQSLICVPLAARGTSLGVLSFGVGEGRRRYDTDDLQFARDLAHRSALAIDNARLYAAERAGRERTERLQQVSAALSGTRTPEQVASVLLRECLPALNATSGAIWLAGDEPGELHLLAQTGLPGEMARMDLPMRVPPDSPAARLFAGDEPYVVLQPDTWRKMHEEPASEEQAWEPIATYVGFPLQRDESVHGLLALGVSDRRHLAGDELEFMQAVITQGAQAMERALLLESAERARAEAEGANAAKSDFLAIMSHELRTPLNAIAGYTQLLELGVRGPVNAEQLEDLGRIQRSQRHLLTLINDILNFARLEAGKVEYELETLPVSELLAHATEIIAPQADTHGVGFQATATPALRVHADREKVQQILLNLLANATRFTPRGGQIVMEGRDRGDRVMLEVRDTGPGIPADQHERVFEPFVQLGRSRTQPGEGTGLGLAISRDLARGMGGDLMVTDADGGGARFILELERA